jgi:hypothetical protein
MPASRPWKIRSPSVQPDRLLAHQGYAPAWLCAGRLGDAARDEQVGEQRLDRRVGVDHEVRRPLWSDQRDEHRAHAAMMPLSRARCVARVLIRLPGMALGLDLALLLLPLRGE